MARISSDEVRHVALLSRLEFSDAEIERFGRDLNDILEYIEKLNELDTSAVPPTSHALKSENVFRADELRPCLTNDEALANAPERDGPFFAVPQVLPEEG